MIHLKFRSTIIKEWRLLRSIFKILFMSFNLFKFKFQRFLNQTLPIRVSPLHFLPLFRFLIENLRKWLNLIKNCLLLSRLLNSIKTEESSRHLCFFSKFKRCYVHQRLVILIENLWVFDIFCPPLIIFIILSSKFVICFLASDQLHNWSFYPLILLQKAFNLLDFAISYELLAV